MLLKPLKRTIQHLAVFHRQLQLWFNNESRHIPSLATWVNAPKISPKFNDFPSATEQTIFYNHRQENTFPGH